MIDLTHLPKHVGIIMDGNRRWAKLHKLAVLQGHDFVAEKVIEPLVDRCIELKVGYLTFWAFSTENWKRDEMEVNGLMNIFRSAFQKNCQLLHDKGIKIQAIGNIACFPSDIQKEVERWQDISKNNTKITVIFALNYGGRDEVMRAIHSIDPEKVATIQEAEFSQLLDTGGVPDIDFIIRTGGEQRMSGFMPWQAVYSELYFTKILMPDFSPTELDIALEDFAKRRRNFGK